MPVGPALAGTLVRLAAVVEAVTWAGLLTGMLFKYVVAADERGVQLFGPLHGVAFLIYVGAVLVLRRPLGRSLVWTVVALVSSVPPFASLIFEAWAGRTERMGRRAEESVGVSVGAGAADV